ncbi:MAG: hypothetical protein VXW32_09255 [Myxococcota bacterium]|nr:hypothetical protein [Myxococcota bacterium]
MRTLLALFTLIVARPSFAQCTGPFGAQDLLNSYQTVQFMLSSGDEQSVIDAAVELNVGLPCLTEKVPPAFYAGVYRVLGAAAAFEGENAKAQKWFLTARELDSGAGFGVDELAFDSPVRALFDSVISEAGRAPVAMPGHQLSPPENSMVLVDGRQVSEAAATTGRYHVVQLAWLDGRVRRSWLIEGNQFPAILVTQTGEAADSAAEPAVDPGAQEAGSTLQVLTDERGLPVGYDAQDFVRIDRVRPPWKTPALVSGGVAFAGSVALYGLSFRARSQFDSATTESDLYHFQRLTNRLSLASTALFVVGGASTSWGVLLGDSPGVGIQFPW